MMQEHGSAAVVHPAGTGKSFIAFKLAEEHPSQRIVWLAPSEYIFRSQKENYLAAGGDADAMGVILVEEWRMFLWGRIQREHESIAALGKQVVGYVVL